MPAAPRSATISTVTTIAVITAAGRSNGPCCGRVRRRTAGQCGTAWHCQPPRARRLAAGGPPDYQPSLARPRPPLTRRIARQCLLTTMPFTSDCGHVSDWPDGLSRGGRPQQPLLAWPADPCCQPAGHSRSESAWLSCADDASDPQLKRPVLIHRGASWCKLCNKFTNFTKGLLSVNFWLFLIKSVNF